MSEARRAYDQIKRAQELTALGAEVVYRRTAHAVGTAALFPRPEQMDRPADDSQIIDPESDDGTTIIRGYN